MLVIISRSVRYYMVKVLQVFKPDHKDGHVDKSKPFGYSNKIACNHDSPKLIHKQEEIYKDKNVPFFITRSKNDNTVAYRYVFSTWRPHTHPP